MKKKKKKKKKKKLHVLCTREQKLNVLCILPAGKKLNVTMYFLIKAKTIDFRYIVFLIKLSSSFNRCCKMIPSLIKMTFMFVVMLGTDV